MIHCGPESAIPEDFISVNCTYWRRFSWFFNINSTHKNKIKTSLSATVYRYKLYSLRAIFKVYQYKLFSPKYYSAVYQYKHYSWRTCSRFMNINCTHPNHYSRVYQYKHYSPRVLLTHEWRPTCPESRASDSKHVNTSHNSRSPWVVITPRPASTHAPLCRHTPNLGFRFGLPIGLDWHQMGQICDFFKDQRAMRIFF